MPDITSNDLSRLFCTCTSTSQATTYTCILSQESVHTTSSITNPTRKWPSTSPRTTQVLNTPLMSALTTHTFGNQSEKEKKRNKQRNFNKQSKAKKKVKSKITWRRQVSVPLGKGNGSTQLRQIQAHTKSKSPPNQSLKPQRAPLHICKLPLNQCNSPYTNACKPLHKQSNCTAQLWLVITVHNTSQTGPQHRSDRCPTYA
jgi:hypothetical protein